MTFAEAIGRAAQLFEGFGAIVLVVGFAWSLALAAATWRRTHAGRTSYVVLRQAFGGVLLLGLEILVAANLIRTVAVAPTLENVLVLGLIVAIRTVLSFSLETEIEGVVPWRRAQLTGVGGIRQASAAAFSSAPTDG